ncbi:MAG TPA: hypothetical protein VHP33_21090 [Polyangiaceae bacterium]|nr:hypothetical protein [Polyangiaceae bacterium]
MRTIDDLSGLFEAERAVRPPPQALEQGLTRLLSDVAQQVAPLSVATGSLKLGASFFSKWLVGGFAVGLAGAGAASQVWAPPTDSLAQVAVARATPTAAVTAPQPKPALAPEVMPSATPAPEPALTSSVRSAGPTPSTVPTTSNSAATFDAELQLITAAKSELDKGRPQLAAAWLAEHAERFPTGIFALDREALRILVRCGQVKDPKVAQAFAARHPSSPMVERLLRACTPQAAAAASSAVDFPK